MTDPGEGRGRNEGLQAQLFTAHGAAWEVDAQVHSWAVEGGREGVQEGAGQAAAR